MERRLQSGGLEEKFLFHGTRQKYLNAICEQGFDWRIAGMSTGTLYGRGSYFARTAKYSHRFVLLTF